MSWPTRSSIATEFRRAFLPEPVARRPVSMNTSKKGPPLAANDNEERPCATMVYSYGRDSIRIVATGPFFVTKTMLHGRITVNTP